MYSEVFSLSPYTHTHTFHIYIYIYIYIYIFTFTSMVYYRILNIISCAIQEILVICFIHSSLYLGFPGGSVVKNLLAMQET